MKKIFIATLVAATITGCAGLNQVLQTVLSTTDTLTETEVVNGLKEALETGARNSASILSLENGYYGDPLVKILLPEEGRVIVDNISRIPGGDKLVEDVVLSINRAAEDAAKEAAPIFVSSITGMSINDAFGILRGENDAATAYLRNTTYDNLYALYKPKIGQSIEKDLVGNLSAHDAWNTLTSQWNTVANSVVGRLANLTPVETDLTDYLTNKALDGMFFKVEEEEFKIRTQISARVTPLLQKVFGSLD
ncbi:MAG TPA: DUF4197 domain-containing protein [Bacteroidetes bacterium]|jgi:hypothetical protein|nr:DUF4197 domain-containing protein [Bacteroidota bacterium]